MAGVKICGITRPEEAEWVVEEGADYAGMVLFYKGSKRYCSVENAYGLLRILKTSVRAGGLKTVAVTVSPTMEQVELIQKLGFDYLQVHGVLGQDVLRGAKLPIIRAINGFDREDYNLLCEAEGVAGFLFDAVTPGSGVAFDWDVCNEVPRRPDKLFFLAGGLDAGNVERAIKAVRPDVVDVSSGVEMDADGTGKDREKIKEFICRARKAGNEHE